MYQTYSLCHLFMDEPLRDETDSAHDVSYGQSLCDEAYSLHNLPHG
ncbi:MAG: hypothetical protein ABGZ23_13535 [Fuerstiella sp.]